MRSGVCLQFLIASHPFSALWHKQKNDIYKSKWDNQRKRQLLAIGHQLWSLAVLDSALHPGAQGHMCAGTWENWASWESPFHFNIISLGLAGLLYSNTLLPNQLQLRLMGPGRNLFNVKRVPDNHPAGPGDFPSLADAQGDCGCKLSHET